jgi:hypothetical protein
VLARVAAERYVVPLKEGGSLPAVVEGSDGRLWVAKFRGAGQGVRALVAEVVCAALARVAGLRTPDTCVVELDAAFGRNEGDPEIRELLVKSAGENLGVAFLPSALTFDPAARHALDAALAARIVAFDCFVQNVDRTAKNPNLLWSGGELWVIDHGAALYWQHAGTGSIANAPNPFARVKDHVLLPFARDLASVDLGLDDLAIAAAIDEVPEDWLDRVERGVFLAYLTARRAALPAILEEAARVR